MSKTILRLQQITIDVPRNTSEPFIHLYIQKVVRDDTNNDIQTIDRYHQVHKKLYDVLLDTTNVSDLVTGATFDISVAGVSEAIKEMTLMWMQTTFGGTIAGDELDISNIQHINGGN